MISDTKEKASRDWGIIQKKGKDGTLNWYARIVRQDGNGKKKQYVEKAENKSHARRLRDSMEERYRKRGEKAIEGDRMTFRKLADLYKERKLVAAEYHGADGAKRKVGGVRSLAPVLHYCTILREHFGASLLKNISHADIEDFKSKRLKTKSKRGERSIADVNRTLALLRSMFRFAVQNGWVLQSPFDLGQPLVSIADETKRERTLSSDEEGRFLAACAMERQVRYERGGRSITATIKGSRAILKALVITALDTAMRKGELLKLRWKDVDFHSRTITVIAINSKTARPRKVGMTDRAFDELTRLWKTSPKDKELLVFGIADCKKSFAAACDEANIIDLRFHDLRHTAITRMVNIGLPPVEIMKVSGHTQWTTFARYVNPDTGAVQRIAGAMSNFNSKIAIEKTEYTLSEFVN
jgi:integrase